MSTRPVEIVHKATGEVVAAELHSSLSVSDFFLVERAWAVERARVLAELLTRGVEQGQRPQSLHWDWTRKAPQVKLLMASGHGIVCESAWQGVMLTKTVGYSATRGADKGKPLVYVDFVEVAPWNWPISVIGQAPRFKGVGSLLIRESIEQSLKEGFHGRVGLHALPQAEQFYGSVCGMTRGERTERKDGLEYFEFTRQQAERFLSAGGGV